MLDLKGIKNIIFDLGGVLLNLDFYLTKQAFTKLGVNNFDNYYTKAQQRSLFDLFETGKLTEQEFCSQLREVANINMPDAQIVNAWNAMLLDFPSARKKLLLTLRKHFNISLLSNTNETHIRAFNKIIQKDINESSLTSLFESCFFSNEIGLRKPDSEAFQLVLEKSTYNPSETLFLDDSIQHVQGARKCGIHAYHVQEIPVEQLLSNFLT